MHSTVCCDVRWQQKPILFLLQRHPVFRLQRTQLERPMEHSPHHVQTPSTRRNPGCLLFSPTLVGLFYAHPSSQHQIAVIQLCDYSDSDRLLLMATVLVTSSRRMGYHCACRGVFIHHIYCSLLIPFPSVASSKHLQTRRFLDTLQGYLHEIQRILVQLHRSANERPAPFVDHLGILRDSKTGRPINGHASGSDEDEEVPLRECSVPLSDYIVVIVS